MTDQQARTCAAVVDQIIPPDDLPGAADAGVVHFIDQALGGFAADRAGLLRDGLADLDRRARTAFAGNGGFADLAFAEQTALLQPIDTMPFFRQMIFLTHCGMFAMPSWGGNRNRAGWALLGFDNRHAWQPPFGYYDAQAMAGEGDRDKG
jgi:gluconate 2-dehydrogenase gamma chain